MARSRQREATLVPGTAGHRRGAVEDRWEQQERAAEPQWRGHLVLRHPAHGVTQARATGPASRPGGLHRPPPRLRGAACPAAGSTPKLARAGWATRGNSPPRRWAHGGGRGGGGGAERGGRRHPGAPGCWRRHLGATGVGGSHRGEAGGSRAPGPGDGPASPPRRPPPPLPPPPPPRCWKQARRSVKDLPGPYRGSGGHGRREGPGASGRRAQKKSCWAASVGGAGRATVPLPGPGPPPRHRGEAALVKGTRHPKQPPGTGGVTATATRDGGAGGAGTDPLTAPAAGAGGARCQPPAPVNAAGAAVRKTTPCCPPRPQQRPLVQRGPERGRHPPRRWKRLRDPRPPQARAAVCTQLPPGASGERARNRRPRGAARRVFGLCRRSPGPQGGTVPSTVLTGEGAGDGGSAASGCGVRPWRGSAGPGPATGDEPVPGRPAGARRRAVNRQQLSGATPGTGGEEPGPPDPHSQAPVPITPRQQHRARYRPQLRPWPPQGP